jgi:SAM-dependent methyltransferase
MASNGGWDASAQAWIDVIGEDGDWGRRHVLDRPMLARTTPHAGATALDIGCGEGRFCRMMQAQGLATIGIDPAAALIDRARTLDRKGAYHIAPAEALPLEDASVDLAVAYLSLIDVPDLPRAISEVRRVLRPGGVFLIANLQGFNTASVHQGWTRDLLGRQRFCIDRYLEEHTVEIGWRGIRITNHHRPLGTYMQLLLDAGFALRHFDEPAPYGVESAKADRYRRVPNFLVMEWVREG